MLVKLTNLERLIAVLKDGQWHSSEELASRLVGGLTHSVWSSQKGYSIEAESCPQPIWVSDAGGITHLMPLWGLLWITRVLTREAQQLAVVRSGVGNLNPWSYKQSLKADSWLSNSAWFWRQVASKPNQHQRKTASQSFPSFLPTEESFKFHRIKCPTRHQPLKNLRHFLRNFESLISKC